MNDEISKGLLTWSTKGSCTEEHFYSTAIWFHVDKHNSNLVTQNMSTKEIRTNRGGITFTSGNTLTL